MALVAESKPRDLTARKRLLLHTNSFKVFFVGHTLDLLGMQQRDFAIFAVKFAAKRRVVGHISDTSVFHQRYSAPFSEIFCLFFGRILVAIPQSPALRQIRSPCYLQCHRGRPQHRSSPCNAQNATNPQKHAEI